MKSDENIFIQSDLPPSQTSEIEIFIIIVNGFQMLIIFAKSFILDLIQGFECAFEMIVIQWLFGN